MVIPLPGKKFIGFVLLLCLFFSNNAGAGIYRLFSPSSPEGDWHEPSHWQPEGIPDPDDQVEIASGKRAFLSLPFTLEGSITLGSSASLQLQSLFIVKSNAFISIGSEAEINAVLAEVRLEGNAQIMGSFVVGPLTQLNFSDYQFTNASLLTGTPGRLTVSGNSVISVANLDVNEMFVSGTCTFSGALTCKKFTNSGYFIPQTQAQLRVENQILNQSGAVFNPGKTSFSMVIRSNGSGWFQNQGVFHAGNQADFNLNSDAVYVVLNTGTFTSGSSIRISGGNSKFRNEQTFQVFEGAGLYFSGNGDIGLEIQSPIDIDIVQVNKFGGEVRHLGPQAFRIHQQLSVLAGRLDLAGNSLVLKAKQGITARIASIFGQLTGATQVTQEQLFPGTSASWVFLGPMMQNQTLSSWTDDFEIRGPFPEASVQVAGQQSSLFEFDGEDIPNGSISVETNGWRIPQTANLQPGRGYRTYLRPGFFTSSKIIDQTGSIVSGPFSFPVGFNAQGYGGGGWNLLSNPYPSPIDINNEGWIREQVGAAIYIWNSQISRYGVFLAGTEPDQGIHGAGPVIPAGQAFFVRATGLNPVLAINEQAKALSGGNFLRTVSGKEMSSIRMQLRFSNGQMDEALIRLGPGASKEFEPESDAHKWHGSGFNISTGMVSDEQLSINTIPEPSEGENEIPVFVSGSQLGSFSLSFPSLKGRLPEWELFLEDRYLQQIIPIWEGRAYAFDRNQDSLSVDINRFRLVLGVRSGQALPLSLAKPGFHVFEEASIPGKVSVKWTGTRSQESVLSLFDPLGREIASTQFGQSGEDAFTFPVSLKPGMYTVRLRSGSFLENKKILVR